MLSTKAHILDLDLKCKRLRILLLLEKKIITARVVARIQSVNSEEGSSGVTIILVPSITLTESDPKLATYIRLFFGLTAIPVGVFPTCTVDIIKSVQPSITDSVLPRELVT